MKKITLALLFTLLLTGVAAGSYYYFYVIPDKLEKRLLIGLQRLGFEHLAFEKIEHRRGSIKVSNITLDKDGFSRIESVLIFFSLSQLFWEPDRAHRIHIHNMRFTGDVSDNGELAVAGVKSKEHLLQNLSQLPAHLITIDKGRADILLPELGGVGINYDIDLRRVSENSFDVTGNITSKQNRLGFYSNITGKLNTNQASNFEFDTEQISLTLPPHIKIRRGAAKLSYFTHPTDPSFIGDIHLASCFCYGLPLADIKGTIKSNSVVYNLDVSGKTFGHERVHWSSALQYDGNAFKTNASIKPSLLIELFNFLENNQIFKLTHALPDFILGQQNTDIKLETLWQQDKPQTLDTTLRFELHQLPVAFSGSITLDDANIVTKGALQSERVSIEDPDQRYNFDVKSTLDFSLASEQGAKLLDYRLGMRVFNGLLQYGDFRIPNIEGQIQFDADHNLSEIVSLPFSFPLKESINHTGRINLNPASSISTLLERIQLDIYDGQIKTQAPLFKDGKLVQENRLEISDIKLSQLLKDVGLDAVSISGTFGGLIPFKANEAALEVNRGIVQSQEPGVIKLPLEIASSLFPGDDQKMKTLHKALGNYHYEFLELRLDGDLLGQINVTLNAQGKNPELKISESVDLNLQLGTDISALLQTLLK